jgi:hypothetical protein
MRGAQMACILPTRTYCGETEATYPVGIRQIESADTH